MIKKYLINRKQTTLFLWGTLFIISGFSIYILTAIAGFFRIFLSFFIPINKIMLVYIMWYSALPVIFGLLLMIADIFFVVRVKRKLPKKKSTPMKKSLITVVLTAFNDEKSIGLSVKDFLSSKFVKRVIVVSNNSQDKTMKIAKRAGAIVFNETQQGYGSCVYRSFQEAIKFSDSELVCLCEGDRTFRSKDLAKFLSYIDQAEIVNGTRIVEHLQQPNTQITTFIHYGNFAVAKLLECKYLGTLTLTDVGTTYKLIRRKALIDILPKLGSKINLEFNPYFIETAIKNNLSIIECPINFYPRVGLSKGGNVSNVIAFKLGLRMIVGIIFGWRTKL
jgi:glycosyltransferase involved in cell wall biosynthesis